MKIPEPEVPFGPQLPELNEHDKRNTGVWPWQPRLLQMRRARETNERAGIYWSGPKW